MGVKRVLVVAAHADDEVLGCGATMARHADMGDSVHVVVMTDGVGARNPPDLSLLRAERESAANSAAKILGVKKIEFMNQPDNQLDTVPMLELVKIIEGAVARYRPDIVYTHTPQDLNIDHRVTCEATIVACRPQGGENVKKILFFEVLSSTEWGVGTYDSFKPNWFTDIHKQFDRKQDALMCYSREMRSFPHPRSKEAVESLAKLRGSACGLFKAEAFFLHRNIS